VAGITFDTLKLAQRLEAAGFPSQQAQNIAGAIAETVGEAIVTREYLDLRLAETNARLDETAARLEGKIAESRAEVLKWMFGAVGLQTLAILGGVAALFRLIGH